MCNCFSWFDDLRVSGRSPELTATGAKRPSGRNPGFVPQAHIRHPVLFLAYFFTVLSRSNYSGIAKQS